MYEKKIDETVITLPKQVVELGEIFEEKFFSRNEFMYVSKRKTVKHMQSNQIREALMKGYVEMSHINLSIASECLHAEYEAEHMVERLVSGG